MLTTEIIEKFVKLSNNEKASFLALLAHDLTVCARNSYNISGNNELRKLQVINEINHQITSYCYHVVNIDSKKYPEDVFFGIIIEQATKGNCLNELCFSFEQVFKHFIGEVSRNELSN